MMDLKIKLLDDNAIVPTFKSDGAAAMDLYAAEATVLEYGYTNQIRTGIAVQIPSGYEGSIRPRSGLRSNYGIECFSGTIDSDYRGEITLLLSIVDFGGPETYTINVGDRVAQMVISPVERPNLMVVNSLDETVRGTGGFGSTGNR